MCVMAVCLRVQLTYVWYMRRRIHVCRACLPAGPADTCVSYEEEDTCVSCCLPGCPADICVSYEEEDPKP